MDWMKEAAHRTYQKYVHGNGDKALLERSGVRTFLGTLLSICLFAWAKDEAVVQAIKDNHEALVPMLLIALGLSASRSGKERK